MERRGNTGLTTTTTIETTLDGATRDFIARIATEVIARLKSNHVATGDGPVITAKVIDTRAIETIASGTTVTIDSKAVVTPSARDEAKQKNITLHRSRLTSTQTDAAKTESTNTIELEDRNTDRLAAAKSQLAQRGIRRIGTRVVMSDTPAAEVASQFKSGRVAVMVGAIEDVPRFAHEVVADVWIVDMKRNHLIAAVNLIAAIARTTQTRPSSQVSK